MTRWTAVVPLKLGPDRKSRLAGWLSPAERAALSDWMASHVMACLGTVEAISERLLLAPAAVPRLGAKWVRDEGRGLNEELDALRAARPQYPLLVVHADLPFLQIEDIAAILNAAEQTGCAIAPDRHGSGTNAVALMPGVNFRFAFGTDSCARHVKALGKGAAIMVRDGLGFDLDTIEDLDAARCHLSGGDSILPLSKAQLQTLP